MAVVGAKRKLRAITEKELFEIVKHIEDRRQRLYYVVLYYTGAREGEILAIGEEDIAIEKSLSGKERGVITIEKQRTDSEARNRDDCVIVDPKTTSSNRQAIVEPWLIEKLKEIGPSGYYFPCVLRDKKKEEKQKKEGQKTAWEIWLILRSKGIIPKRPLTKDDFGSWETLKKKGIIPEDITLYQVFFPYKEREVRRLWENLRDMGIAPRWVSLNHFRRSRETELLNAGYPPAMVANMIGHAVSTQEQYYRLVGVNPYKEVITEMLHSKEAKEIEEIAKAAL